MVLLPAPLLPGPPPPSHPAAASAIPSTPAGSQRRDALFKRTVRAAEPALRFVGSAKKGGLTPPPPPERGLSPSYYYDTSSSERGGVPAFLPAWGGIIKRNHFPGFVNCILGMRDRMSSSRN